MRKISLLMPLAILLSLQACGSAPGAYTYRVMSSPDVDALMKDASGDGAGLQTYEASASAWDGSHGSGYHVRARRTAAQQSFDGQIMLPKGVTRNGVGPQDQRQRMSQEQGGHLW